jgi:hypothetical protein
VAGTPADIAAAEPPAGRAEGEAAPSANERAGRGLGWSTVEILALCSSGLTVDRDSVRGAGMKRAERARRLLAEFKRSPNIPESVITIVSSADNGDSNDSRRWLGRTAAACLSQWEKFTSKGSDFQQIMTRVKAKPWTGSPEEEDFARAVTAIRNRSCKFSNHYSVLRSTSYPVGMTFPFEDAYHFLVAQNYFVAKPQQESPAVYPTGTNEAASAGADKTSPRTDSDANGQQYAVAAITGAFSDTAPVTDVFSTPQCRRTAGRKRPEGVREAKRKKKRG